LVIKFDGNLATLPCINLSSSQFTADEANYWLIINSLLTTLYVLSLGIIVTVSWITRIIQWLTGRSLASSKHAKTETIKQ